MNRIKIAQESINKLGGKTYLEIGVSKGHSFFTINARRKIAVDPAFQFNPKKYPSKREMVCYQSLKLLNTFKKWIGLEEQMYFEMTSDSFFKNHYHTFNDDKIDVALVDGLHTYEQVLQDVMNCLNYLNDGGVIIMHDCSPTTNAMAVRAHSIEEARLRNPPDWDLLWCGDVWKAIVSLRCLPDLDVCVIDCDTGIGIVQKKSSSNRLTLSISAIENLTYDDLCANRNQLLNLKPESFFFEILKGMKPFVHFTKQPEIE